MGTYNTKVYLIQLKKKDLNTLLKIQRQYLKNVPTGLTNKYQISTDKWENYEAVPDDVIRSTKKIYIKDIDNRNKYKIYERKGNILVLVEATSNTNESCDTLYEIRELFSTMSINDVDERFVKNVIASGWKDINETFKDFTIIAELDNNFV